MEVKYLLVILINFWAPVLGYSSSNNLRAFERLSYNELVSHCLGREYVQILNAVLALAIDDCFGNVTFRNQMSDSDNDSDNDFDDDLDDLDILSIINDNAEESRRNRRRNRNNDDDDDDDDDDDYDDYDDRNDNDDDDSYRDNRRKNRNNNNRNNRRRNRNNNRKNKDDDDDDDDYNDDDDDDDDDRRDNRDYNRRNTRNNNNRRRNRNNSSDRRRNRDSYDNDGNRRSNRDKSFSSVVSKTGNTDTDYDDYNDFDDDFLQDKNRLRSDIIKKDEDDIDDNYGYRFKDDDRFSVDSHKRKKRDAFRPDLTSISDLITREIALEEKFLNYECVLKRRFQILNTNDIRDWIVTHLDLDSETRSDYADSLESCRDHVDCLMEIFPSSDIFPRRLRRLFEMSKCAQNQLRLNCIKSDLRSTLPESSYANGTLTDIFEDLLDKIMEIVTFNGNIESYNLIVI